jgi:hypothetical protein
MYLGFSDCGRRETKLSSKCSKYYEHKDYIEGTNSERTLAEDLHTRSPRNPLSLWEKIDELNTAIPASEWSKLPKDGSVNVDHYLYGSPILY